LHLRTENVGIFDNANDRLIWLNHHIPQIAGIGTVWHGTCIYIYVPPERFNASEWRVGCFPGLAPTRPHPGAFTKPKSRTGSSPFDALFIHQHGEFTRFEHFHHDI
jgi:hypothetical protein